MTKVLSHDQCVGTAYTIVEAMLDANWLPSAKIEMLQKAAPHYEQISKAETDSYHRSRDETLTACERAIAQRDEGILNIATGLLGDFMNHGLSDKRLKVLLTPFQ